MFPPILSLFLFFFLFFTSSSSSPYSSIAISHTPNSTSTLVCALIPSPPNSTSPTLTCTTLQSSLQESYSAGSSYYSAIAAGDGFLCALSLSSNLSTMRWWDLAAHPNTTGDDWASGPTEPSNSKRVYRGPPILALAAGDTHVCAIRTGDLRRPYCWRWPELNLPDGLNLSAIAVGKDFLCGLSSSSSDVVCFGGDEGVVRGAPGGRFARIAAGTCHACGVTEDGEVRCWGDGAPAIEGEVVGARALALGENRTCVLMGNWTVGCWGDGWDLPTGLEGSFFAAIEARGATVCGVLSSKFSLVCWGGEDFGRDGLHVYDSVLPGTCVPESSCRECGILDDSGRLCGDDGVVCQPCPVSVKALNLPGNSTINANSSSSDKRRTAWIVAGSVVGAGFVAAVLVAVVLRFLGRRRISDSGGRRNGISGADEGTREMFSAFVREFSLSDVAAITGNFSETQKIGSGSFGSVYRATLDDGRVVAVKRASATSLASTSSGGGTAAAKRRRDKEAAFMSELALLSRVNHKNLVRLIGYCHEGAELALVYEYMSNGSLHDHLHKLRGAPLSSWGARLRVALDAARGIEYLHAYAVPPIIHRDIKSANILLDDTWTAKVSDFGLSLMNPIGIGKEENDDDSDWPDFIRVTAGTVGYMDPEGYRLQHLTAKSDVYSFGVVLLELITGCKAIHRYEESGTPRNVVEFAVPHIIVDNVYRILDPNLPPPVPDEIEAVTYVSYLAADCVSPEGRDRPTMSEVVSGLERAVSVYGVTRVGSLRRSSTIRSI